MIRLWSLRFESSGDYSLADYDPETRMLHYIEGRNAGTKTQWNGDGEPWDAPGKVQVQYTDGDTVEVGPFPAMWEKAIEGQPPSPGYGTTPSELEKQVNGLLSEFFPYET